MERFHTQRYFLRITCLVTAILFCKYLFSQETTIQTLPVEEANLGVVTVQEAGLEFRYEIYPQRIMIGDPIFVRCQVTNQTGKNWDDFPIVPNLSGSLQTFRAMYKIAGDDPSEEKSRMFRRSGPMFMLARELCAERRGCLIAGETTTWWECQHQTSFVFLDEPNLPKIGNSDRYLPKATLGYDDLLSWLSRYPEENQFCLRCSFKPAIHVSDTVNARSDIDTTIVINLRSEEELQAIKTWVNRHGMSLYGSYQRFHELNTTLAELQEFEQQLSPGTFRDEIHKEILIKRLLAAENPELFVQVSDEMITWLETLPELQQRGLAREIVPCIEALKERDPSKFTSDQTFAFTDENIEDMKQRIRSILE